MRKAASRIRSDILNMKPQRDAHGNSSRPDLNGSFQSAFSEVASHAAWACRRVARCRQYQGLCRCGAAIGGREHGGVRRLGAVGTRRGRQNRPDGFGSISWPDTSIANPNSCGGQYSRIRRAPPRDAVRSGMREFESSHSSQSLSQLKIVYNCITKSPLMRAFLHSMWCLRVHKNGNLREKLPKVSSLSA
jgi:hypothetical protein